MRLGDKMVHANHLKMDKQQNGRLQYNLQTYNKIKCIT